ncbi:hypothetical protein F9L33_13275 [Amylibacter sp. SFDW26]|uniref:hypothetical protein n=1 Tax=Amylibacter sp. SFDW26 TaxID=2652722 RepID=UPI0012622C0B|nr:hypothetical protein [Amylibacter sp. SFDW26]KAB7610277.1 hypothetical protein F9L33_13275 [Amylibacter sp. SFDW26]
MRSKHAVLEALKRDLGRTRIRNLDRATIVQYGKKRAKAGAGVVTLAVDLSYIGTVLTHVQAIHGITVDTECMRPARVALKRLAPNNARLKSDTSFSNRSIQLSLEITMACNVVISVGRFGAKVIGCTYQILDSLTL